MTILTEKFDQTQLNKNLPDIRPGDLIRVYQKIKEGDPSAGSSTEAHSKSSGQVKERIQIFEGIVIARKHGKGISSTITVRKVVEQVGVEKIFPVHSPSIDKIEVVKSSKVRRSKLYYLRTAKGTKAKLKKKDFAVAIAPKESQIPTETETIPQPSEEKITE